MSHLSLRLFGTFHVALDNARVVTFESDKVRALLTYLVVEAVEWGKPHRREVLAGLFWPDSTEAAARRNLSQALFNLRQAIGDQAADPPYLLITREAIHFNPASNYWLDVAEFKSLLADCEAHAHSSAESCAACVQRWQRAVDLYQGDFMPGFSLAKANTECDVFEEWLLLEREMLRQAALEALWRLTHSYEQCNNSDAALRYAQRQIELDPLREEAYRQAMKALMAKGERAGALAKYDALCRLLNDQLGIQPSSATQALYDRIQRQDNSAHTHARAHIQSTSAEPPEPAKKPRTSLPALPTPLTSFIGRERERRELTAHLSEEDCRLLVIVGQGGIGKTRLALQIALDVREQFADGVAFVPLASVNTVEAIVQAIANAVHFALSEGDTSTQLLNHLRDRYLLIVLDNFEHLLAPVLPPPNERGGRNEVARGAEDEGDAVTLLSDILRQAPQVKILVTSREQLDVQSEWVCELDTFNVATATELFVQRARQADNRFSLTDSNRRAIARIAALVDGLPLGIELAASWVRALSLMEIAQEIERNLDFLSVTARNLPVRHRSIRAVFDYSWQTLVAAQRKALMKLTVFRGGFTRESAQQVAGTSLSTLASLVHKSLLRRTGDKRYGLHEMVRQYAAEKLAQSNETQSIRDAHLDYFVRLAESADLEHMKSQQTGQNTRQVERLEHEEDNLRAAQAWALEAQRVEQGYRMANALWRFWQMGGRLSEGYRWVKALLALQRTISSPETVLLRAKVLRGAGVLARIDSYPGQARMYCEESLAISRTLNDAANLAEALNSLGVTENMAGNLQRAAQLHEESLSIMRQLGDRTGMAQALRNLADIATECEDRGKARAFWQESLEQYRQVGDPWLLGISLWHFADMAMHLGDDSTAQAYFTESLEINRQVGRQDGVAWALSGLGQIASRRRQVKPAKQFLTESLQAFHVLNRKLGIAACLPALASVAESPQWGAQLLGAHDALLESAGSRMSPTEQRDYDRIVAELRTRLSEQAFTIHYAEGRRLKIEEIIAHEVSAIAT